MLSYAASGNLTFMEEKQATQEIVGQKKISTLPGVKVGGETSAGNVFKGCALVVLTAIGIFILFAATCAGILIGGAGAKDYILPPNPNTGN